jgi:hypothetical protein
MKNAYQDIQGLLNNSDTDKKLVFHDSHSRKMIKSRWTL